MKAEIICVGTELLVGEILNTNSQYVSKKLAEIGIDLYYQTTVGDNFKRIKECLKIAFNRVDLVITIGGLGPTVDDITKEVIGDYFNEELQIIPKYYNLIKERYSLRGWDTLPSGAEKEASIIKGSKLIENTEGLAPSFFFEKEGKKIIVLPGPPKELKCIVDNEMIPLLSNYSDDLLMMKTLEIKGVPEGIINDKLKKYFVMENPTVAPYAKEKAVHIRVAMKGKKSNKEKIIEEINKIIENIKNIYPMGVEIEEEVNNELH